MMVGILVLPRGMVGMIEASITRKPSTPRTRPGRIGDRVTIVRGAHAAGSDRMEGAGDVFADVIGKRSVVLDQSCEIDTAVGKRRKDRSPRAAAPHR